MNFKILLALLLSFFCINNFILATNVTTINSTKEKIFFFDDIDIYTKIAIFNDNIKATSKIDRLDAVSKELNSALTNFANLGGINLTSELEGKSNTTTADFILGISASELSSLEFKYFDNFKQKNRVFGFGFGFLINIKPSNINLINHIYPYIGLGIDFANIANQEIGKYEIDPIIKDYVTISNIYKDSYSFSLYSFQFGFNINLPIKDLTLFTEYQYKYGKFADSINLTLSVGGGAESFSEVVNLENTISSHNFGIGIKYIFF